MTSGNPMVDNQDRNNNPTKLEQREEDIRYDKDKLLIKRRRIQEELSPLQQELEEVDKQIDELENELNSLYDYEEIEE